MNPQIIYQDDNILVLDKPAGWITNEADTTTDQPVVQNWLKKNFEYPISNIEYLRSGIVHRLDKETSGILLVAKTKESFEELQRQFKSREVEKSYTALAHGRVDPPAGGEGEISAPVGRLPWRRDRFGVLPGGREAVTHYESIKYYVLSSTGEQFTLVELKPKTGRTHQIRIHLKYIGHPIVADEFYTGRKTARTDRKWCPRLFLHASEISFNQPQTKKQLEFTSELPNDLSEPLATLTELKIK